MKLDTIENIIETLESLLESTLVENNIKIKRRLIGDFSHLILNTNEDFVSEQVDQIMVDLAMELDSYEPNEKYRKEDPSFYDDIGLIKTIDEAIEKLRSLK